MPRNQRSWLAVFGEGHSFFQRLGTLSRYFVTEEGDLGSPKNALCWVDDPISLLGKESMQVLFMLFE
jgi:hypothetical protein